MRFRFRRRGVIGAVIGTAIGATLAVVAAPLVIGAIGFGATGIAAGSIAALIAKGGAIAAGSLVASTVGLRAAGIAGVGAAVGGGVGAAAYLAADAAKAMWIIVRELDGNERRFSVKSSEPLQRMFDQYYDETGLSAESVIFEFIGLRLRGSESPAELGIESEDVINALRIR